MSMIMEILEGLWNTTAYYKGTRVNIFGYPMPWKASTGHTKNSINSTVSRMRKRGLVEVKNGRWSLTEKGRKHFEEKRKLSAKFGSPFTINAPKNLLLMFDIPQSQRAERDWLRRHLKEFQYVMIQQSVWVGPSPLPPKFKEYIKEIKIDRCIKTFKLANPYK